MLPGPSSEPNLFRVTTNLSMVGRIKGGIHLYRSHIASRPHRWISQSSIKLTVFDIYLVDFRLSACATCLSIKE